MIVALACVVLVGWVLWSVLVLRRWRQELAVCDARIESLIAELRLAQDARAEAEQRCVRLVELLRKTESGGS